jgi:hypothetical protein
MSLLPMHGTNVFVLYGQPDSKSYFSFTNIKSFNVSD